MARSSPRAPRHVESGNYSMESDALLVIREVGLAQSDRRPGGRARRAHPPRRATAARAPAAVKLPGRREPNGFRALNLRLGVAGADIFPVHGRRAPISSGPGASTSSYKYRSRASRDIEVDVEAFVVFC
ncbi:hypothetical protein EVAR_54544_1 [Eumeta japonica]|uniref:Uncharacterized protein n=1 Tax=Eumeta variegata TaxID=151549 RepID=A0A4C1YUU3_EUMVA|nr:hypothetical protein EVAR_54544_1 [Eumeta japonica]